MQASAAGFEAATSLNPPPRAPRLPATSAAQHRRIRSRPCPDVACGGADGKDGYGRQGQDRDHRVQAARPGGDWSFDGRRGRALAAHRRRVAEAPGGRGTRARPAEHRQRVHGDDRAADRQSRPTGRRAVGLLAGLHDALAEYRAAYHGRGERTGDRRPGHGSPLQGRCVARERGVRLHQAELPAVGALCAGRGATGRRDGLRRPRRKWISTRGSLSMR